MVDEALVGWLVEEWVGQMDRSEICIGKFPSRVLVGGKATRGGLESLHSNITLILLPRGNSLFVRPR